MLVVSVSDRIDESIEFTHPRKYANTNSNVTYAAWITAQTEEGRYQKRLIPDHYRFILHHGSLIGYQMPGN